MMEQYRNGLDEGKPQARAALGLIGNKYTVDWSEYLGADWSEPVKTAVDMARLRALGKAITTYPADWILHPRVLAIMQARERMVAGDLALDWGCAENLAYASLVQEGYPIRLTGQDSGRGTFFHRHAVLHDQATGRRYVPLQHLATNQPTFTVTDSVLSEEAVMGFEYGFSTTEPHCLTIWEGQFGDFGNGAQVIIDQFISSGEAKWGRLSGLTLFLPHGYEGQGPEHSSARLERFLQLCAEYNMQVCVPSTPAQMFHMLRRQMVRPLRKPLIVMTPKSLLRHPLSVSRLEELAGGAFLYGHRRDRRYQTLGRDAHRVVQRQGVFRLVEGAARSQVRNGGHRAPRAALSVSLRRIRGDAAQVRAMRAKSSGARKSRRIRAAGIRSATACSRSSDRKHELLYAGRAGAAAPATGISALHEQQQKNLVTAALQGVPPEEASRQTMRLPAAQTRTGFMTIEVRVPQLPESVADATLVSWHKKPGDAVARDENLVDLETDKVVLEVPAPAAGVLKEIRLQRRHHGHQRPSVGRHRRGRAAAVPGASAPAIMAASGGGDVQRRPRTRSDEAAKRRAGGKLSPAAKRVVEENKVDPKAVAGSGRDGRVSKSDVVNYLLGQGRCRAALPRASPAAPKRRRAAPAPVARGARAEQRVPMTRLRARIAERMVQAQATQALADVVQRSRPEGRQ